MHCVVDLCMYVYACVCGCFVCVSRVPYDCSCFRVSSWVCFFLVCLCMSVYVRA